jgi:alcohol dehydrogenase class IV
VAFSFEIHTRVLAGEGRFEELGALAREMGFTRTLLTADKGLVAAGYVERAVASLIAAGIQTFAFDNFAANPDSAMIEAGCALAAPHAVDSIIGLGGGSSLDCAKGINFLLTNGGHIRDYWGWAKAARPMLPMIAVPTTAGTGSEAQSYALISDAATHVKMACGDPKAAFRAAILDPMLTCSQPRAVTAAAGYDAISHAVESFVTTKRSAMSQGFAREAWRLLEPHFECVLCDPGNLEARAAMQLGAHLAGIAIENSMLGATHACANPLTAHYGTVHGVAIAALLHHVVRWNLESVGELYQELGGGELPETLAAMARSADLPLRLRDLGIPAQDVPGLAAEAAQQWTGRFNPRPFGESAAREIYESAW